MLRRVHLEIREMEWEKTGDKCMKEEFTICILHKISLGWSNQGLQIGGEYGKHEGDKK